MQLRNGKVMQSVQSEYLATPQNSAQHNAHLSNNTIITDERAHKIFKNIVIDRVTDLNDVISKFNEKHDEYKTEQYDIFLENTVKYAKRAIKSLVYLFEFIDCFDYGFLEEIEEYYPVFMCKLRNMVSEHYTHSKIFTIYYKMEGFYNKKYMKMMKMMISILGKLGPNIKNVPIS